MASTRKADAMPYRVSHLRRWFFRLCRALSKALRSFARIVCSFRNSDFPIITLTGLLVSCAVAVNLIPSSNRPVPQLSIFDTINVTISGSTNSILTSYSWGADLNHLGANQKRVSNAMIYVHAAPGKWLQVKIEVTTEKGGLLQSCYEELPGKPDYEIIDERRTENGWTETASWVVEDYQTFRCDLDVSLLSNTDGATTAFTSPNVWVNYRLAGPYPTETCFSSTSDNGYRKLDFPEATEFAGQECETRNPSPSGHSSDFVPYVIEYEDSMPERANQNTRTLMFGVLLGLAGGFAASLVAWGDSRRRDRREETQKQ